MASAVNATTTTTTTPGLSTSGSQLATKGMGKDDFLKLFVTQLQHQDPMNPMQDAEFMGQMAQFSTLEQITNVDKSLGNMAAANTVSQSVSLLGKTVTYTDQDGNDQSGVVSRIVTANGLTSLVVGDTTNVDPSAVTQIEPTKEPATS